MKHNFTFTPKALKAYQEWAVEDKQVFKKINELLDSIDRTPFEGPGKPEPLKHQLKGAWSRRISDEHRLVYEVTGKNEITISTFNTCTTGDSPCSIIVVIVVLSKCNSASSNTGIRNSDGTS